MIKNNAYYEFFASYKVPNGDQVGYWIDLGANPNGKVIKVYNSNIRKWVKVTDATSEDAVAPYIGSNGNWFVDSRDTGVPASGKNPYVGDNGNWFVFDALENKYVDSGVVAKGKTSYDIAVENGYSGSYEEYVKLLQDTITYSELVKEATANANNAAENANEAADRSNTIANNPPKIVNEIWYRYDEETGDYVSTGVKAIGDAFTIVKTYSSVAEMQEDYTGEDVKIGQFVMIDTGDVNNPEDSQLYLKGDTEWKFISDLSGAQGIQGLSAYQVAVQEGFVGTEEEWLASLKGEPGEQGPQGEPGPKGEPGSDAEVTKENVEAVLTGNITTHTHDQYLTDAPVDGSQYVRQDGAWQSVEIPEVDLSNYLAKDNTTEYTPTTEYNPATKKYVDEKEYTLPTASSDVLGGIKVGAGLKINPDTGVLSATGSGTADSVDWANITSKPDFKTVATTGSYNDLIDKPTIPTKTSELTNDSGFITSIPEEYVTETELAGKNYATVSQIPSLDGYATEAWVGEQGYLTEHQDISNLATKSELASKADSANVYSKSETYTKTETDSAIKQTSATVFKYKGAVDNYEGLPTEEVSVGDVYSLRDTNGEYVATKASPEPTWEYLGVEVDLSQYSTTVENDGKYQPKGDYALKSEIPDTSGLVTKNELSNYATTEALTQGLSTKADTTAIPTKASQLTNDSGYLTDAPSDGKQYGRKNNAWAVIEAGGTQYLDLSMFSADSGTLSDEDYQKVVKAYEDKITNAYLPDGMTIPLSIIFNAGDGSFTILYYLLNGSSNGTIITINKLNVNENKSYSTISSTIGLITGKDGTKALTDNGRYAEFAKPTKVESGGSGGVTKQIKPNTFYIFGEVARLTITLATEERGILNEYMFQVVSGSTPVTLLLPDSVKWSGGNAPTIEANKTYQISIVNNYAVYAAF